METLSFSTPARTRVDQPVDVDFCGEKITVRKPKQAVLYFAQTVIGDTVSDADRAMALLQFLDATFSVIDRKRYFDRIMNADDPVNLQATLDLIEGLVDRWNNWPAKGRPAPVVVTATSAPPVGDPVELVHADLDLRFQAHPVKDIVLLVVSASMATGANAGQQAWAISLLLDAALTPGDAFLVARRMRDPDDDLDLEHIAEMVSELLRLWSPSRNRADRRRAARTPKTTTNVGKPPAKAVRKRAIQRA